MYLQSCVTKVSTRIGSKVVYRTGDWISAYGQKHKDGVID